MFLITFLALPDSIAQTNTSPEAQAAARELKNQRERIDRLRQEQERAESVLSTEVTQQDSTLLDTTEDPCFLISQIELVGDTKSEFSWLTAAASGVNNNDTPIGKCLGAQGVNLVLRRMQNALVERGFITSRVSVAPQDLRTGTLEVSITPGRISEIRFSEDSKEGPSLNASIPTATGDLLNLRHIEHGLENFRNTPSGDADIKIIPGSNPGESDILVFYSQKALWRFNASLDNSGSKPTGKYQGSFTAAGDNLMGYNDLLYFTLNSNINGGNNKGTKGGIFHYSMPFKLWSFSTTLDTGSHKQNIIGAFQNYEYSGRNTNFELKASRLAYRDSVSKTTVSAGVFKKLSNNFIDDTEVEVQRRRTGGWFANINHRRNMGVATLDTTLGFKKGTGGFGSIPNPEEAFGEGTSRFGIGTLDISYSRPFVVLDNKIFYQFNFWGQYSRDRLASPQRFYIGGRYSVRGFDGESALSANNGFFIRNELSTIFPNSTIQGYTGLDFGRVSGFGSDNLAGKHLVGGVVGIRSNYRGIRYDLFIGAPISKPKGFDTPKLTAGFSLNYSF